jgi:phytol kinase
MLYSDLIGIGLYLGFIAALMVPTMLIKVLFHVSSEVMRKVYHLAFALSIYPLVTLFSTWYMAVLATLVFILIGYPALALLERTALFKRIAVEREGGEFKSSLVIAQLSMALLLCVFWGLLGSTWRFVAVVAVMAWGSGDAAAALVGTYLGRRQIEHPHVDGSKTMEGTHAMFVTASLAVFLTLLFYAGQPWRVSLAVGVLAAPVCAVVELFSRDGMDTVTVPISAGLAVVSLLWLISLPGV